MCKQSLTFTEVRSEILTSLTSLTLLASWMLHHVVYYTGTNVSGEPVAFSEHRFPLPLIYSWDSIHYVLFFPFRSLL